MARKINGPFCDVSIQTVGHVGSTTNNNDVFFNLMHSEMAMHNAADEFSSTQRTQFVDRIKRIAKLSRSSNTTREDTQNLDPFIDITGPKGFQNKYY